MGKSNKDCEREMTADRNVMKFHIFHALQERSSRSGICEKFIMVPWISFKEALLAREDSKFWEGLTGMDLVLGGIPLSGDFMCV